MQRTAARSFVQHGVRGPGIFRATQLQPAPLSILTTDTCLIFVVNKTREGLTVHAESRTPQGPSFLDSLTADLDVGGVVALFCCAGNDLHMDCSNGLHKLSLHNGELRLLPGGGFRQKMTLGGLHTPAKYLLHVEIEEVVESKDYVYPTLQDALSHFPSCVAMQRLVGFTKELPPQCTLLLPRTLPRALISMEFDVLVKYLTIPVALFFEKKIGGVEKNMNGDGVEVRIATSEIIVFEISASVQTPSVRLTANLTPVRCFERFQLIYVCE